MSEIGEEQLQNAVHRLRRWDAGESPSSIYPRDHDPGDAASNDAWGVAREYISALARREAERIERAKTIDAEWLESMGFRAEHDLAWHADRVSVRQYANHHGDVVESTILLDGNEIIWHAKRGQLLDLIAALKGGGE